MVSASLGLAAPVGLGLTAASGAVTGTCPGGSAPADRFTDDDTSVHEAAIACSTWWDLTRGVSATAYAPSRPLTRGQAAALVARMLSRTGLTLPASPPDEFADDTGGAHSYATNRLAAIGVLAGRADGRFAPSAALSRGAMASLLVGAYRERSGVDPPRGGDHFSDDDGTVHERAIDQAAELGLTHGAEPGRFDPWATVSRAQAASFLARALTALDGLGLTGTTPVQLHAATALEPVGGCEPLLGEIKERALESVGPFGLGSFQLPLGSGLEAGPLVPATGGDSDGGAGAPLPSSDSSGTNNQEVGVDEADLVKVQGTLVVAVNGGRLRVNDAAGGTPVLRGSLDLGDDADHRLLLDGSRLLVMSTSWWPGGVEPGSADSAIGSPVSSGPLTTLRLIDLSTLSAPVLVDSTTVNGLVLGARLVAGVARVVVRTEPAIAFVSPDGGSPEDMAAAVRRNREIVETSTLADWTPRLREGDESTGASEPLLGCADVSSPPEFAGLGFSSVLTVDLAGTLADPHAVGVLAGSDLVYASPTTLYLTSTRWQSWRPSAEAADPTRTDLHAFDITAPTGAAFLGSGRITGHLLNQFSLSEHEGVLRVASTTEPFWWDESAPPGESRVTTLRLTGGSLTEVGLVTGIGIGERIFGVRFLGDRGYVITFRQIDPLHVLDLSDPAHPIVTGELEMPGYSAYLHPISAGLLLGVGADADADGRRTGLQLSLFDVTDPTAPRRLSHTTLPGAYSDVEYDHLAFLWWPAAKRVVLPVGQYAFDDTGQILSQFEGAIGFSVDPATGIDEVGRATHVDDAPVTGAVWPGIRRSLVVNGRLLTLSDVGLETGSLTNLTEQSWLSFTP
jgi:hypothetical protein